MSSTGWIAPSSAAARCNGMELLDKLAILTDAAKYDAACTSSGVRRSARPGMIGNTTSSIAGCCHSFSADGRCITLLKVLMTNSCVFDCKYCVNRRSNDTRRAAFTPRELAELTIGFYRRNYIEGLFLSSGVLRSPDYTTERMIECLRILREEYRFNGYIHAKAIPGTSPELVQRLGLLAAFLHEWGHIGVYLALFGQFPVIEVTLTGFCMRTRGREMTLWQTALLAAAGPAVNFVLAGLWMLRLEQRATIRASAFLAANLLTGAFNLLPIPPLDGAQLAACGWWCLQNNDCISRQNRVQ